MSTPLPLYLNQICSTGSLYNFHEQFNGYFFKGSIQNIQKSEPSLIFTASYGMKIDLNFFSKRPLRAYFLNVWSGLVFFAFPSNKKIGGFSMCVNRLSDILKDHKDLDISTKIYTKTNLKKLYL